MKALVSIVLSITLFTMQVGYVHAENPPANNTEVTAAPTNNVEVTGETSSESYFYKKDGEYIETNDSVKVAKEKNEEGGYSAQQITLFALAFTVPVLYITCRSKISAWIFGGAAALYLLMEIMAYKEYKASSEAMEIRKDATTETQIESMKKAAEQTDEAAAAAEKKAGYAKMAAMMFAAASVAAFIELAMSMNPARPDYHLCSTADAGDGEEFKNYAQNKNENFKLLNQQISLTEKSADTMMVYKEWTNYFDGEISSPSIQEYESMTSLFEEDTEENTMKTALLGYTEMAMNFVFPKAEAANSMVAAGLGGVASAIVLLATPVTAKTLAIPIESGLGRGITFGIFAGVAGIAAKQIGDAGKSLRKRAEQYRGLGARMSAVMLEDGQVKSDPLTVETGVVGIKKVTGTNGEGKNCYQTKSGQTEYDQGCKCRKNNTCKKSKIPKVDFGSFDPSGTLASSSSLFNAGADGYYSGDYGAAGVANNGLSKNAAKISRLRDSLKNHLNKVQAKVGKKPIDFDGLESKIKGRMLKAIDKAFKNSSSKDQATLMAIAAPLARSTDDIKVADKALKKPALKLAGSSVSLNSKGKKKSAFEGIDFDMGDEEGDAESKVETFDEGDDEIADLDITRDDISSNRDADIFKLITTRYMKTAYPVFFDEDL